MTALSIILCLAALLIYKKTEKDWLGIEAVKKRIRNSRSGKSGRLAALATGKFGPIALFALSIKFDPFITTICLCGEDPDGKLTKHDAAIFMASVFISNGYWLLVMHMGRVALRHF